MSIINYFFHNSDKGSQYWHVATHFITTSLSCLSTSSTGFVASNIYRQNDQVRLIISPPMTTLTFFHSTYWNGDEQDRWYNKCVHMCAHSYWQKSRAGHKHKKSILSSCYLPRRISEHLIWLSHSFLELELLVPLTSITSFSSFLKMKIFSNYVPNVIQSTPIQQFNIIYAMKHRKCH